MINIQLIKIKLSKMINYEKLMSKNPTEFERFTNSKGQEIAFVEYPEWDDCTIICVCHELKLACDSEFFETDDMLRQDRSYEPSFQDGRLWLGDLLAD